MRKSGSVFLSAVGAGLAISVGGTVYLSLENKIAGALLFTIGLYAIVLNGLYLYTGKVGYLVEQKNKKEYGILLVLTWLGNRVGTGIGAAALCGSRINGIRDKAYDICQAKLADTPGSLFLLAIFCGMLMYIAVDGYKKTENPIILFLCVSVFILSGFEHCIANMFYFSLAGVWSFRALFCLLVITLGNSVGGVLIPFIKKAEYTY